MTQILEPKSSYLGKNLGMKIEASTFKLPFTRLEWYSKVYIHQFHVMNRATEIW